MSSSDAGSRTRPPDRVSASWQSMQCTLSVARVEPRSVVCEHPGSIGEPERRKAYDRDDRACQKLLTAGRQLHTAYFPML